MKKPKPPSPADPPDETDPTQQPESLDACRRCDLWRRATQAVRGEGKRRARIMLVGEQPGDGEDLAGKPFVGPAGKLLDRALADAGIPRDDVFITNAVKHFKWELRGKRRLHKTPGQREVQACMYWLERELEQEQPAVVVALGATALKALLDDAHARLQEHFNKVTRHAGRTVLATWHPSYALRAPDTATRERAYADIVAALKHARTLASGK
ncbi:UdgX family uracil-DNA binding protein [Ralstonia mannitolilytica]|uniref:UdgX family uracil-DNA binding protein n=1 Tax=Ralstonia mannitolilytica TaxID=105219 RepID=UPI0028F5C581|nr:UdgX family uracil-DNA binding protein [Ralstonia mannitolilytica]CAJ0737008.1 Type-4 uracil-DNA glycosylase [Ralstonia mannitolilytica]